MGCAQKIIYSSTIMINTIRPGGEMTFLYKRCICFLKDGKEQPLMLYFAGLSKPILSQAVCVIHSMFSFRLTGL